MLNCDALNRIYSSTYRLDSKDGSGEQVALLRSDSSNHIKLKSLDSSETSTFYLTEIDLSEGNAKRIDQSMEFDLMTVPTKLRPEAADCWIRIVLIGYTKTNPGWA